MLVVLQFRSQKRQKDISEHSNRQRFITQNNDVKAWRRAEKQQEKGAKIQENAHRALKGGTGRMATAREYCSFARRIDTRNVVKQKEGSHETAARYSVLTRRLMNRRRVNDLP
ncbi:hypothetical protein AFK62_00280 [Cronobacter condimenti 1330]|uniref:Uncharacterized protein n=1 Tax=Cronobacter condimenti 1330 TaxID=1073999 RepID=A0ABM5V8D4_9ENTR|nr:hypothetical protein AFK62_00280 [Cronobacter condimenti 1330]